MKILRIVVLYFFLSSSLSVFSHPEDELIISEIEEVQDQEMTAEYEAALKRQRNRRLAAMPWTTKFFVFTKAGVTHIIPKGLDHILFVLGLFFSSLVLSSLLWQVSAFTLAHTITLALAAFSIIKIPGSIVEPLIALSIVWIAVENIIFKKTSKWRTVLVFAFGLLHGLGFAAVLNDYGLPKGNFISSLLAFNIGVEIGQLVVLLAVAGLFWFIRKKSWYRKGVQIPASLLIGLVGLFWFIERLV